MICLHKANKRLWPNLFNPGCQEDTMLYTIIHVQVEGGGAGGEGGWEVGGRLNFH